MNLDFVQWKHTDLFVGQYFRINNIQISVLLTLPKSLEKCQLEYVIQFGGA